MVHELQAYCLRCGDRGGHSGVGCDLMHYYSLNIADYRKDTQHLTPLEHYVYRELIDWYYLDEAPIPKITKLVLRRLRLVSENNQDLQNVLEEFFEEGEEGWVHHRIETDIRAYHAKVETAKVNGSKGGRPKKPKKTKPVNLANPSLTGSKANHKPITNNQEPLKDIGEKAKRFVPPTIQQVKEYCLSRNNQVDPERFIDHYTSNGWHVGKNKMKDWTAAVRTWEKGNSNATRQSSNTAINHDDTSWLTGGSKGSGDSQAGEQDIQGVADSVHRLEAGH